MAWLATDKDGQSFVYKEKPHRAKYFKVDEYWDSDKDCYFIDNEAVEVILGRNLTWEDEPVEIKEG